jgi:TatD DNase family protein
MWIDIHAHLYDKSEDKLQLNLDNASSHNVTLIINSATNIDTAYIVASQCKKKKHLLGVAGISPFDVEQVIENWKTDLTRLLDLDKIIGVGEIGLDNTNPIYPSFEKQIPVFEQQLELARDLDLPVVIHSRGAENEAVDFCMNQNISRALFHCFTGNKISLKKLLDSGYYASFSGIITFKNSPLEELVRFAPLDRIFIETDTPYLSPHPYRGKPNEPAYVSYVGEKIADIKNLPVEKTAKGIWDNFTTLFNISASE